MTDNLSPKQFRFAILTLIIVLTLFGIFLGKTLLTPDVSKQDAAEIADERAVELLARNCVINLEYRKQDNQTQATDAEAQRLQVEANEALINVVNRFSRDGEESPELDALGAKLDRVNKKLNELRSENPGALPLPNCDAYADILNEESP